MPTSTRGGGGSSGPLTAPQKRALARTLVKLRTPAARSERSATPSAQTSAATRTARTAVGISRAAKRQSFIERRNVALRNAQTSGKAPSAQMRDVQEAGFIPGGAAFKKPKGALGLLAKTVGDLAEAAYYTPAGAYGAGKAIGQDAYAASAFGGHDLSFKRSRAMGSAMAHATAQDFEHPLRHPGYTLLDALGIASAGAGTATRIGAASRALRAGEGVGKALARPAAEGGSLLHTSNPGTITVRHGGLSAQVPAFKNPLARALQKGYHKARPADAGRVGKAVAAERRITEPAARAQDAMLGAASKRLTLPQETAIRVVHEGKPIGARIDFHEAAMRSAKTAAEARNHKQKALLLKAAARYVTEDAHGKPILREQFHKPLLGGGILPRRGVGAQDLARISGTLIPRSAAARERTLVDAGRLEPGQIESRVHGPGQVIEGSFRRSSDPQLRIGDVLDVRHGETPALGHLPTETIRTRLAALDKTYNDLLENLSRQYDASTHAGMTAARNITRGKVARGRSVNAARRILPTIRDEARALVERHLAQMLKDHAHDPAVQRLARQLDEAATLREELHLRQDASLSGHEPSVARATYEPIPAAEPFAGGRTRIPYTTDLPPRSHASAAAYRGGIPRAPGSTTHEFTGGLLKTANFRDRSARLVAESGIEAHRYGELLRLRDRILSAAKDHPDEGDVPIKVDAVKLAASDRALLQKAESGVKLSRAERRQIGTQYEALRESLFKPQGTAGIKYVPAKLLDALDARGGSLESVFGSPAGRAFLHGADAVNNASRLAILYLKPAYAIPNLLGNAALTLFQQGFAAIPNLKRAARLSTKIGDDAGAVMDQVMGEGFAQALAHTSGPLSKATNVAAGIWSKGVDLPFRRAAFIHEARKLGFNTNEKMRALLLDEKHAPQMIEAAQRANRALIDYGRLSRAEREIVRRVIFFYPWVKGSTMYAGHFIAEHPIQAATQAQLGRQGKKQAQHDLGNVPSFAEGIFKVGGSKDLPLVSNPAAASILGTPAQVALALKGVASGDRRSAYQLSSFLTPAAALGYALSTHRDAGTGRQIKGGLGSVLSDQLLGGLPQATLARRLKQAGTDQSSKLYPTSTGSALEQFGLGSLAPRRYNVAAGRALASKENRAQMSPVQRALDDGKVLREKFLTAAIERAALPANATALPKPLHDAIIMRTKRYANYARAGVKRGTPSYQADAFAADVDQLRRWGKITPAAAATALRWAKGAKPEEIQKERRRIAPFWDPAGAIHDASVKLGVHVR